MKILDDTISYNRGVSLAAQYLQLVSIFNFKVLFLIIYIIV